MAEPLPDPYFIEPAGPVHGTIRPPGSKSITNRALVCAALAPGTSQLDGVLLSEDTEVMQHCLRQLGIGVREGNQSDQIEVDGCGGIIPEKSADLFVANSGTTIRFLTALVSLGTGSYRLDGVARMRERPIGDLLDALRQLGVDSQCELSAGCPPILVRAHGLQGGNVRVRGDISSQFLSGLLMAAPCSQGDVAIDVDGELVSAPYVAMTLAVMDAFGVEVHEPAPQSYRVKAGLSYRPRYYPIEPDASAASYFWAAAAITGGQVTVEGLSSASLQGDIGFCDVLRQMGCSVTTDTQSITVAGGHLTGVDVNMNSISDTVQTLAAVALFADGSTRIRGVAHNRHKETDRIGDLARELRRLGAEVAEYPDGLEIHPRPLSGATLATYNDHRMAMSLALVGLRVEGVQIENPRCTAKTYPQFFADLGRLIGRR